MAFSKFGTVLSSQGWTPSIVTATRLNFCVRHGNRCCPRAMGTKMRLRLTGYPESGVSRRDLLVAALPYPRKDEGASLMSMVARIILAKFEDFATNVVSGIIRLVLAG
jgi:hypothetical protein